MGIKNGILNHHTTDLYDLKMGDTFMLHNRPKMVLGTYQTDLKDFVKSCQEAHNVLVADLITGELSHLNSCTIVEPISVVLTEDLSSIDD